MSSPKSSTRLRSSRLLPRRAHSDSASSTWQRTSTKVFVVGVASDADVQQHPEIAPFLREGWELVRSEPRVVESEGMKLLVVLRRPARVARLPASPVRALDS